MKNLKTMFAASLAVLTAFVSMPSFAAAIDVSGTVTDIGAQLVPIGLIGIAVLGVILALKAFHWVRRALS